MAITIQGAIHKDRNTVESGSGYPDATNTGVPAGTTLTAYTGPATITTAGTVIDSKLIEVGLVIQADNVTIKNCLIRTDGYFWPVLSDQGASGLMVQDCEIDGLMALNVDASINLSTGGTILRCNIHGAVDGIKGGDGLVVQDCYIHDLMISIPDDTHNDGIQCLGTFSMQILHNTFIILDGATSCILLSTGFASDMRNILVDNNLFAGGNYIAYCGYQSGVDVLSKVSNITFSNNKVSTQIFATGGGSGRFTSADPPVVLSNNTWYDGPNAGLPA